MHLLNNLIKILYPCKYMYYLKRTFALKHYQIALNNTRSKINLYNSFSICIFNFVCLHCMPQILINFNHSIPASLIDCISLHFFIQ